jgi:hypothetical protein
MLMLTALVAARSLAGEPAADASNEPADAVARPWSFGPLSHPAPPAVNDPARCRSPIDRFILARLEARSIRPAAPAGKPTLIRRATYDLIGLPPTPDEIADFVADDSPQAFERVVERLLASPQYGERWGRHWLDVVRYADARDLIQLMAVCDFREIWRYRDWVVDAFNSDLPYDRFLACQIAGDLLQPDDPGQIDRGAIAATGLLALADFVPGDRDKTKMVADYVADQVDVVGQAMLGLTIACARCHDHKFDPISTRDYYALAGIFFSTRLVPDASVEDTPLVRVPLLSQRDLKQVHSLYEACQQEIRDQEEEITAIVERDYGQALGRLAATETAAYLMAVCDWRPTAADAALADFAAAQRLDPQILKQWLEYLGANDYRLASRLAGGETGQPALSLWGHRESLAAVGLNHELTAIKHSEIMIPPRSVFVCPSTSHGVSIGWRSPLAGQIELTGRVARSQTGDGPAMVCHVDHKSPVWRVQLATAAVPAGTDRPFTDFEGGPQLATIDVQPGETIEISFPAGGRGMALVEYTVREIGGGRVWNLTPTPAEKRPQADEPSLTGERRIALVDQNPLADAAAEAPGVWRLCEFTADDRPANQAVAGNVVFGEWNRAASKFVAGAAGRQAVSTAALGVQQALMAAQPAAATDADQLVDPPPPAAAEKLLADFVSSASPFRRSDESALLTAEGKLEIADLRIQIDATKVSMLDIPHAVAVQDGGPAGSPHEGFNDAHVLVGGNPHRPGQLVPRGFPQAIAPVRAEPITEGSGRRQLASWLTSSENPLPARVMANRIWQHHFGQGIVRTPNNFGTLGDPPSHPELLDFLARSFIESGWSIKQMHRLVMLSATYQQSSQAADSSFAADPENRWLGRANRRQLDAEQLRDSLLTLGGNLDLHLGGSAFDKSPTLRRTLYSMSVRSGDGVGDFPALFGRPDPSSITAARNPSIVAPQALFLMNDEFVARQAEFLAARLPDEDTDRVAQLYQLVLGRDPTVKERAVADRLLADQGQPDRWQRYCQLLLWTNEFLYID